MDPNTSERFVLRRDRLFWPWIVGGAFVGALLAGGLVVADFGHAGSDERMAALLFGVAAIGGAVLGFAAFGLSLSSAEPGTTYVITPSSVTVGAVTVRLDEPHGAWFVRGGVAWVELSAPRPRAGMAVVPLPPSARLPDGWIVFEPASEAPEGALDGLSARRVPARAGALLIRALTDHESLNEHRRQTRWIPFSDYEVAMVEHVVREELDEHAGDDGPFRRGHDDAQSRSTAEAIIADAKWHDEHIGATKEWLVVRETHALALFPVGFTTPIRREGAVLYVSAPHADGMDREAELRFSSELAARGVERWLAVAAEARIAG